MRKMENGFLCSRKREKENKKWENGRKYCGDIRKH